MTSKSILLESVVKCACSMIAAIEHINNESYEQAQKCVLEAWSFSPFFANAMYLFSLIMSKKGKLEIAEHVQKRAFYLNPLFFQECNFEEKKILREITISFNFLIDIVSSPTEKGFAGLRTMTRKGDYNTFKIICQYFLSDEVVGNHQSQLSGFVPTFFMAGMLGEAEKYIQPDSDSFHKLNNKAVISFAQKKYEICDKIIENSFASHPDYPQTKFLASLLYQKQNKLKQAKQMVEEAISQRPEMIPYKIHLIALIFKNFREQKEIAKAQI